MKFYGCPKCNVPVDLKKPFDDDVCPKCGTFLVEDKFPIILPKPEPVKQTSKKK